MVARVIGRSRLTRLLRADWITPTANSRTYKTAPILYAARDIHGVLRRLERGEILPPIRSRLRKPTRHGRRDRRKAQADTVDEF